MTLFCGRGAPRTGQLRSCYLTNMHRNAEIPLSDGRYLFGNEP
jgi:hypothetical protein